MNPKIEKAFTYHPPKKHQAGMYSSIRETAKMFAYVIDELVPDSREKSLAMTKLEECVMWANAGIAQLEELGIGFGQKKPDMVEVVRCKDCKHRGIAGECLMCYTEDSYDEDYGYDYWDVDKTVDDGFCHCGEKVDAEVEG